MSRAGVEPATHSLKGEPGYSVREGPSRPISFAVLTYFVCRRSSSARLEAFRSPSR